MVLRTAYCW